MPVFLFEWDITKEAANKRKHRVSFEEGKGVFLDTNALLISDPAHSENEDRFILLGLSLHLRLLVVCHCYRKSNEVIRIISVRRATNVEQKQYEEKL